jgi:hypothetical protein
MNDNVLDEASSNVDSEDDLKTTCGYEGHYPPHAIRERVYVQKQHENCPV